MFVVPFTENKHTVCEVKGESDPRPHIIHSEQTTNHLRKHIVVHPVLLLPNWVYHNLTYHWGSILHVFQVKRRIESGV